ncbi:MAG: dienelactone hydrolase family protein [Deltaproteobacteria bacterium]|nr:dienelactone hydrolase family protein [Deltaproteobacteria bacterium]
MSTLDRVDVPVGESSVSAVISRPEGASARVGVVVIQEWWGLVAHIEEVVARVAGEGFVAMSPDLYHGASTVDAEEASHLASTLDWSRAIQEIVAVIAHLRVTERCEHVVVVGFCMGGALAVLAAANTSVEAYVSFYGFPPEGAADLKKVSAPGLILFGESEAFFSVPNAQKFAAAQRERAIDTSVHIYPGASHAFFNDHRPEVFAPDAARDAWSRMLAVLHSVSR